MISIEPIDSTSKAQVNRFINMPYHLYKDCPQWVPPIRIDEATQLDRTKHPFYEHSEADFFVATENGKDVGRITALANRNYNDYHKKKVANFYHYDAEDNLEVSTALIDTVAEWAKIRGLDTLIGPKGLGPLDGYGLLVEGFEHRQMMTMMNYNHPYLPEHLKQLGFKKEVDFISCYLGSEAIAVPPRVKSIAARIQKRGTLRVIKFNSKKVLREWALRIGKAYNQAFIGNWEYCPLTDKEIDFVLENILTVARPELIKIVVHDQDVVGFLFGFPDVSAAIQRSRGRLLPFGIFDILLELRRTKWIAMNGMGILPEFQGRGGNALLYAEMEETVKEFGFEHLDMTQIAESAVQMRKDLVNLGGKPYKNHRVFRREI
jgi:GNAT superfamily N-acetyltransferase